MNSYWSEYWQQGHVNSFADSTSRNYEGELAEQWLAFFNETNVQGGKVVDLATGNGALIDLAVNVGNFCEPEYIGVDYATLKIGDSLKQPKINFLQEQNIESLPFKDNEVTAVVSQFGIEYSNLDLTLSEVSRVLRPGGKLRVVVHRKESAIVAPNFQILKVIRALQEEKSPLDALKRLVSALSNAKKTAQDRESIRLELNEKVGKLVDEYKQALYDTNFPKLLKTVLNPNISFSQKETIFKEYDKELESHGVRLSDLINAARDAEEVTLLKSKLACNDFVDICASDVVDKKGLIGTTISAVKRK